MARIGVVRERDFFFVPFVFRNVENSVAKYLKTIDKPNIVRRVENGFYMTPEQFDYYKNIVEDFLGEPPEPKYSAMSQLTNEEISMYLDFSDVLICPKNSTINSRFDVELACTKKKFKHSPMAWTGTPIIVSNMDTTGTFDIYHASKKYGIITAFHKFYTADDYRDACKEFKLDPNYFMVSVGLADIDRLVDISKVIAIKWICIDVANGYIPKLIQFCKIVRKLFPEKIIVAGNVVTADRTVQLLEAGVDVVKIGIGPGAACTTRLQTGIGMPQLSAIQECSAAAHKNGGMIIGDGGITCPGDMVKAFGGGADFVMAGSLFAGHTENPGCIIEENGSKYKLFYGMSSHKAMEKHGGVKDYRASEGRALKVKYKGNLRDTIIDYFGGIRSACTYIGAKSIDQIHKHTTFIQVHRQANFSLVQPK